MENIHSEFRDYDDVIQEFSEKKINERYENVLKEITNFLIQVYGSDYDKKFKINTYSLMHALLDYFTDISRLKSFHNIATVNEYKIFSYEIYWFLKRHPIQILEDEKEENVFINEKFALTYVSCFLLNEDKKSRNKAKTQNKALDSFINSFYYYLKFRVYTPCDLEMILLSFKSGKKSD